MTGCREHRGSPSGIPATAPGTRDPTTGPTPPPAADVVITMGCGDACPVFPGKRYEEWVLEDPAGLDLTATRPIRDEIERRVRGLLSDIGATPLHSTAR